MIKICGPNLEHVWSKFLNVFFLSNFFLSCSHHFLPRIFVPPILLSLFLNILRTKSPIPEGMRWFFSLWGSNQLPMNWWFGARWFGILGIPLSNNPFHNRILGIQTTRPQTNDLPLDDLTLKDLRDEMIENTQRTRGRREKKAEEVAAMRDVIAETQVYGPPQKKMLIFWWLSWKISTEWVLNSWDRHGLVFVLYEKSLKSQIYF